MITVIGLKQKNVIGIMENKGCLFTKEDWDRYYEIQSRTKSRNGFVAGRMTRKYPRYKCIFCKKIMANYHLSNHIQRDHRDKIGYSWDNTLKAIKRCKRVND